MPQLRDSRTTKNVGAGLTMAVAVGLFSYGGYLLDQRTGLQPLFLLLGLLLGSVGGFLHVVSVISPELLPGRRSKGKPTASDPDDAAPPPTP